MKFRNSLMALFFLLAPVFAQSQTFTVYTSLGKASATYTEYEWLSSYYDVTFENVSGTVFKLDYFTFLGYLITIESESPKVKVQWSNTYDTEDYRLLEIKEGESYFKYDFKSKVQTTMFSTNDSIVAMKEALKAFANGLDASKFKGSGSSGTTYTSPSGSSSSAVSGEKVYLNYPGEIYSTFDLKANTSVQSTLRGLGLSQTKIDEIATYSEEDNWPYGINTLDERTSIRHKFRQYHCYQIASFSDKVILEVPVNKNQHMDGGMRPTSNSIYFIVGKVGVRPASFYYKEGLPKISITDPGELYSTIDLEASTEAMSAMRSAGMSEPLIKEVLANSTESAWPEGLNTLDERLEARDNIKSFNAYQMAVYGDKVILLIPREGNRHVPSTILPVNDMYMVIGTEGLSGVNRYFKRAAVETTGISAPVVSQGTSTPSSSGGKTWAKAKIYDSGKMYTTYNLKDDVTAMNSLYDKGYSQKLIDDILYYANESRWPSGISTLSNWQNNKEVVNDYNAYQVSSFGDKQILYIPKDQNTHMPSHMQIDHDFFMVIGNAGVTISSYSSISMPTKFQGTAATKSTGAVTTPVSSSVTWDLTALSEVKIVNVGRLYSTYNLSTDFDAQGDLKRQGLSQSKIDDIIAYGNEKNWPEGINTFTDRSGHWEDIAKYRVWVVGSFDDKVILLIPKSKNLHMSPDYRPTRDIYFIIGDDGVN